MVGAAVPAAAHGDTTIGASGHCSDGSSGGGGSVGVGSDGSVDGTSPSEIQSVIAGLLFFFQQKQANPDRADTCDGNAGGHGEDQTDSYDYIEAHAGPVQACYSEENAQQNGGLETDGDDACADGSKG